MRTNLCRWIALSRLCGGPGEQSTTDNVCCSVICKYSLTTSIHHARFLGSCITILHSLLYVPVACNKLFHIFRIQLSFSPVFQQPMFVEFRCFPQCHFSTCANGSGKVFRKLMLCLQIYPLSRLPFHLVELHHTFYQFPACVANDQHFEQSAMFSLITTIHRACIFSSLVPQGSSLLFYSISDFGPAGDYTGLGDILA